MNRFPKWLLVVLAVALLAGVLSPVLAAENTMGKFKNAAPDYRSFVVWTSNTTEMSLTMLNTTVIQLNGSPAKLQDLRMGDTVKLIYEKRGDQNYANEVHARR
jgi:hypothetical protein